MKNILAAIPFFLLIHPALLSAGKENHKTAIQMIYVVTTESSLPGKDKYGYAGARIEHENEHERASHLIMYELNQREKRKECTIKITTNTELMPDKVKTTSTLKCD